MTESPSVVIAQPKGCAIRKSIIHFGFTSFTSFYVGNRRVPYLCVSCVCYQKITFNDNELFTLRMAILSDKILIDRLKELGNVPHAHAFG